jgi:hypothetical protein
MTMEKVTQLLSMLLVLVSGLCLLVWAGWYDENIDFGNLGRYARQFPGGPEVGPLAGVFGSLFVAWLIYPSGEPRRAAPEPAPEPPKGKR